MSPSARKRSTRKRQIDPILPIYKGFLYQMQAPLFCLARPGLGGALSQMVAEPGLRYKGRESIPSGIGLLSPRFTIYNSGIHWEGGSGQRGRRSAGWPYRLRHPYYDTPPQTALFPNGKTRNMHNATWASKSASERKDLREGQVKQSGWHTTSQKGRNHEMQVGKRSLGSGQNLQIPWNQQEEWTGSKPWQRTIGGV